MKYCKNCVMPDTKPGVYLDERGLCNACRSQEIKSQIDWKERFKDLEKIVSEIKTAVDFALESPFPDESELYTNVYI